MEKTTQKAIAQKLKIPPSLLCAILHGDRRLSFERAHWVEEEYGIPIKVFREWLPTSIKRVLVKKFGRFRLYKKNREKL